jgi:hypothetical protein
MYSNTQTDKSSTKAKKLNRQGGVEIDTEDKERIIVQKPNSSTSNFVEVSVHSLESS